ncbi:hypothetical protein [Flavisolibacter nicotianae]|uniref:hypothetical protein n=1 Tax=Flavisolibacter nicotianae TaxID=2364882 RepID=UPI000EB1E32B|nr:hypothetical protein [Flavisolibacter nicotianae]
MNDFETLIEKYSSNYYLLYSSIQENEWGLKAVGRGYLEKYGLTEPEYETFWKPLQDEIFINQDRALPEMVFGDSYRLIALRGGVLFEKADFESLQACFLELGERSFVVIENTFGKSSDEPPLRMKYPAIVTWEELMSGNFISSVLFEMPHKEYFVFGQTAAWGKYSANDFEKPLDIIGFKPELSNLFMRNLTQPDEEWQEVREWLPPDYKDRVNY